MFLGLANSFTDNGTSVLKAKITEFPDSASKTSDSVTSPTFLEIMIDFGGRIPIRASGFRGIGPQNK